MFRFINLIFFCVCKLRFCKVAVRVTWGKTGLQECEEEGKLCKCLSIGLQGDWFHHYLEYRPAP